MHIASYKTNYGRGPKRLFLDHRGRSISVRECFRHPLRALKVLLHGYETGEAGHAG